MRFSLCLKSIQRFGELVERANHAERTGWDGVWLTDHFTAAEDPSIPRFEAWITLSGLAAQVPRVRIGTLVSSNTFRHPAVLAKMAATLDHISGGRVVLGLGSGWNEYEHRRYGIPFYNVTERLRRLDEACEVIKKLFTEQESDFDGQFYQLDRATLAPKPLQDPLPLMIGGGGEKMTLKITAKYADEWNVYGSVEDMKHKMSVLDRHCETVGRDPKEIQRSAAVMLYLSDDEVLNREIRSREQGRPALVGNISEVRAMVEQYAEIGVDELIIPDNNFGSNSYAFDIMDAFIQGVAGC
jgi:F420-dependent oxidoreductase-like protein